jgi:hypothetical protein
MAVATFAQTVGASFYKIIASTHGKNDELWKHPYWQTFLTTFGEMMAFLVYFVRR